MQCGRWIKEEKTRGIRLNRKQINQRPYHFLSRSKKVTEQENYVNRYPGTNEIYRIVETGINKEERNAERMEGMVRTEK